MLTILSTFPKSARMRVYKLRKLRTMILEDKSKGHPKPRMNIYCALQYKNELSFINYRANCHLSCLLGWYFSSIPMSSKIFGKMVVIKLMTSVISLWRNQEALRSFSTSSDRSTTRITAKEEKMRRRRTRKLARTRRLSTFQLKHETWTECQTNVKLLLKQQVLGKYSISLPLVLLLLLLLKKSFFEAHRDRGKTVESCFWVPNHVVPTREYFPGKYAFVVFLRQFGLTRIFGHSGKK